jgi:hypothetical protein
MNSRPWRITIFATVLASVGCGALANQDAYAQTEAHNLCKIEIKDGFRYISANGIPDHSTGQFPNRGNPNSISAQDYHFRVPVTPNSTNNDYHGYVFGVAINGVPFDPGTAELWNGDRRWHYEALTGMLGVRGGLGVDRNNAHVQPNGAYHYHGLPIGLLEKLNYQSAMALVGYAADGYPIYGPYCYIQASDPRSGLRKLTSSYRLKSGSRANGSDGPGGIYDGSFAQDYEYIKGSGDLDQYNGRFGVTPEYTHGTFYYVLTYSWPFVPRKFRGIPDSSFRKEQGPPGRGQFGSANGGSGSRLGNPDRFGPQGRGGFRPPGGFGDHPPSGGRAPGGFGLQDAPPGGGPFGGGPPEDGNGMQ